MGILIGGNEPRNNLSAMLSNSGLFTSNGRSGWTIRVTGEDGGTDDDPEEEGDPDFGKPADEDHPGNPYAD